MNSAKWMLRRDGKHIPCGSHIYGSHLPAGTLAAAEWLWENTKNDGTRTAVLRFIAAYGRDLNRRRNAFRNLKLDGGLTPGFLESVIPMLDFTDHGTADELAGQMTALLNDEFIRVSFDGETRDMRFCIASADSFDWSDVICGFVKSRVSEVATVTIIRDETATGEGYFYEDQTGAPFDRYPV